MSEKGNKRGRKGGEREGEEEGREGGRGGRGKGGEERGGGKKAKYLTELKMQWLNTKIEMEEVLKSLHCEICLNTQGGGARRIAAWPHLAFRRSHFGMALV